MQLDNLDSAWKQLKLLNAMHPIASKEILSIIENDEHADGTKTQRVLACLVVFMVITIFCQGG